MAIKNQQIIEVPTLLDALDYVSCREMNEQDWDAMRIHGPGYELEGKFVLFQDESGEGRLYPVNLSRYMYYRGERKLYPHCYATLYRDLSEAEKFIERLKYCELSILIEDYPLTKMFRTDLGFPYNGSIIHVPLSIDALALAQHYGICTNLIDVTVDKWVAAFFACTYRDKDGIFHPVTDESQYGMFNIYFSSGMTFPFNDSELSTIGLQPFSRPGEQAGYVVTMEEGEDFYDKCAIRIKFKHDARVSELVFNYTNRANKLFPQDVLEKKVEEIKATTTFSHAAYALCKELYYEQVGDEVLNGYLAEQGKDICSQNPVCFTEIEKQDFYQKWPDMARRMAGLLVFPNLPRVVRLDPNNLAK